MSQRDPKIGDVVVVGSDLSPRLAAAPEKRDHYRSVLRQANEELLLIADDAPEDIGERIDSVRALLKDALND